MLSLHTNNAALSAQNSISRTQSNLSTSMTRLSTGYRINSAMDDAAGLQIATRLQAQTSGMNMAMRNTQNSISMIQTADGALDETTSILVRMKDLATQAADGSAADTDRTAMQSEYDALTDELTNIISNTSFGGTTLLSSKADSKFNVAITFQIGSAESETMDVDLATMLGTMHTDLTATNAGHTFDAGGVVGAGAGTGIAALADANNMISTLDTAIESVSTVRSALGAAANRLDHVYNNLSNMSTNTKNASGRIMDVDFATESASMMSSQMLLQAGTAMLKQSNSQSSLVLSLLQ
ncbi:flagellin N-terminal helical domain-containing protein [Pseudoduganella namucuonensis]|uniref:Flagellin n=1 Tax=Pseudoduganella namucuonensis TaxID=1035707 RepID=A0A1I7HT46_9BURK|nr:flagellin [Pseudoduganella namucuonensis]SFU63840.1 flagellin [Pseudoduganella namucuonensis]